jgi:hypothetical protein
LSDQENGEGDSFWYSKWFGRELPARMGSAGGKDNYPCLRSGTLVTMENGNLFTLFIEAQDASMQTLIDLADQIFDNFEVK